MRPGAGGVERRGFLASEWPEEPSVRYIIHWLFRREKLCSGWRQCNEALQESGGEAPCAECPATRLDDSLTTVTGQRVALVVELDHAREAGITVLLSDINYAEMLLLRTLTEEREAYIRELNEQAVKRRR